MKTIPVLVLQGILDSYEKELTVSGSEMDTERVAALEKNLEAFRLITWIETGQQVQSHARSSFRGG